MKLCIETNGAVQLAGIDGGLKMIRDAGFDGADLSFYWANTALLCAEDYREKALEVKAALEKYGLECSQAHAPFDFVYGMEEKDSCFEYLSIKRAIEACGIIGIDHIVVHGVKVPEGAVSKHSMEYNYGYFKRLETTAKRNRVRISIENLSGSMTYPELINDMLEKLSSPWFTALVDTGHAWLRAGIQPGDFIRQLTPGALTGLHVQDTHGPAIGIDEHLLPFLAEENYASLISTLKETDYKGNLTLEVPRFLEMYAQQGLLEEALCFAGAVGRKLVRDFEEQEIL